MNFSQRIGSTKLLRKFAGPERFKTNLQTPSNPLVVSASTDTGSSPLPQPLTIDVPP